MPGERKSVEPMAAITAPERTAAQHQSLLHFVGAGGWSGDRARSTPQNCGGASNAIIRNSSRRSGSAIMKAADGAASIIMPPCASRPVYSWSPKERRSPLRTTFRRAAPATCPTPQLPTPRIRPCGLSGISRTRSPRCADGSSQYYRCSPVTLPVLWPRLQPGNSRIEVYDAVVLGEAVTRRSPCDDASSGGLRHANTTES
jgi:hypothetical protein